VIENVAAASTRLLRKSDDPLYVRLRNLLNERGINVESSALAAFFPDDGNVEFGVLVTQDRHVYEFDLHYGKGDLSAQVRTATITDWRDCSTRWAMTPSKGDVEDALRMLGVELAPFEQLLLQRFGGCYTSPGGEVWVRFQDAIPAVELAHESGFRLLGLEGFIVDAAGTVFPELNRIADFSQRAEVDAFATATALLTGQWSAPPEDVHPEASGIYMIDWS
jgi:hypothetical protein